MSNTILTSSRFSIFSPPIWIPLKFYHCKKTPFCNFCLRWLKSLFTIISKAKIVTITFWNCLKQVTKWDFILMYTISFNICVQIKLNFHKSNSFFSSIDELIITRNAQQHEAQVKKYKYQYIYICSHSFILWLCNPWSSMYACNPIAIASKDKCTKTKSYPSWCLI